MPGRRTLGLETLVVLVEHQDRAESRNRRPHGGAGADDDVHSRSRLGPLIRQVRHRRSRPADAGREDRGVIDPRNHHQRGSTSETAQHRGQRVERRWESQHTTSGLEQTTRRRGGRLGGRAAVSGTRQPPDRPRRRGRRQELAEPARPTKGRPFREGDHLSGRSETGDPRHALQGAGLGCLGRTGGSDPDDPAADAPPVEVDPDTGPDQRRRIGDRLRPEVVEDLVGSGAVREDPDHRDRCRRGPG